MKKPQKAITIRRHEKVRKDYQRLISIKKDGVRKHHEDWVMKELEGIHFNKQSYLEDILGYRL